MDPAARTIVRHNRVSVEGQGAGNDHQDTLRPPYATGERFGSGCLLTWQLRQAGEAEAAQEAATFVPAADERLDRSDEVLGRGKGAGRMAWRVMIPKKIPTM